VEEFKTHNLDMTKSRVFFFFYGKSRALYFVLMFTLLINEFMKCLDVVGI